LNPFGVKRAMKPTSVSTHVKDPPFQFGPLVGKPTWGGLVGILVFLVLMDGGSVTAPNLAFWTEDSFIVENEGVAPDVEVEQTPKELIAGRDPQLEKVIEVVLQELETKTPVLP